MTAKEKAIKLVSKFMFASIYFVDRENGAKLNAKQCAIIAVDEIINLCASGLSETNYWNEVKKEIELL